MGNMFEKAAITYLNALRELNMDIGFDYEDSDQIIDKSETYNGNPFVKSKPKTYRLKDEEVIKSYLRQVNPYTYINNNDEFFEIIKEFAKYWIIASRVYRFRNDSEHSCVWSYKTDDKICLNYRGKEYSISISFETSDINLPDNKSFSILDYINGKEPDRVEFINIVYKFTSDNKDERMEFKFIKGQKEFNFNSDSEEEAFNCIKYAIAYNIYTKFKNLLDYVSDQRFTGGRNFSVEKVLTDGISMFR